MRFRKCSGYAAYPLFAVLLFAPLAARAQGATPQQQPTDTTQQQSDQTQPQSTQQRTEVLREAQERVNARRKIRIKQIIQDTYSHKYELDWGGGYLRFRPGNTLQHNSESSWNVDLTDYLRGDLGVTVEGRGYYGTAYTGTHLGSGIAQAYEPSISQYAIMAGPRYRFFKGQHWGWTGQVEAGMDHGNFGTGTNGLPPQLVGLYTDTTVLAVSAGASVDYNLGPGLAFRLTPNYLITNFGSTFQYNAGWNLGVVYRFGRK
ncbi:MAG TPA: outer membrane beta-barrel protein [Acidobacteriaceae bacterium]|jgi:hypothetical protein|nr:outer membrane beta-barrel protein [Acidobacteriaceae bacterium]